MKLKIITLVQVSKNQHRLKEKIENEIIEEEELKIAEGRENAKKRNGSKQKCDGKFICQCFSSTV